MKYFILYIILFLSTNTFSQEKIFKDFNFSSGDYALIFLDFESFKLVYREESELIEKNKFIDNNTHYILESKETLNLIKENWTGIETYGILNCKYDYYIYLTKNDTLVSRGDINIKCNRLNINNKAYDIDSFNFNDYLLMADTLFMVDFDFGQDINKAKEFYQSVENDSLIVLKEHLKPKWENFDENYRFKILKRKPNR